MKLIAALVAIATLTACASGVENEAPVQESKATPAPKTQYATKPLPHPDCNRDYQSLDMDVFNNCIKTGLTYHQVGNTVGHAGELIAESGDYQTYRWSGSQSGSMHVRFKNKIAVGKSQVGLER